MPGMDGFINFNGTLEGSIAGGGGGDVTDVKVRDSQETTFESVVNEQGVAEIDLISYVRRNELTQAIENIENSIDNVEQLVDTKQNIINYSTDEQVIGTYFGKPRYQKTYQFTKDNIPLDRAVFDVINDIKELVRIDGGYLFELSDTDHRFFAIGQNPSVGINGGQVICLVESRANLTEYELDFTFQNIDRSKINNLNVTLEYTKTTD